MIQAWFEAQTFTDETLNQNSIIKSNERKQTVVRLKYFVQIGETITFMRIYYSEFNIISSNKSAHFLREIKRALWEK